MYLKRCILGLLIFIHYISKKNMCARKKARTIHKEFLGHKKLDTTLLHIQIEKTLYKEQTKAFKVAKNKDEITDLLATGFDYICEKDGLAFFRKRK
jgi:hypothetical protein